MQDNYETLDRLQQQYWQEGNYAKVIATIEQKLERQPENFVEYYREIARIYLENLNAPDQAIAVLQKAAATAPHCLDILCHLQQLLYRQQRWEEYLECGEQRLLIISDHPKKIELLLEMAAVCRQQIRYPQAESYLTAALAMEPVHPQAIASLVQLYQSWENWRALAETLEKQSTFLDDQEERRRCYWQTGDIYQQRLDDPATALRFYQKAHQLFPDSDEALARLQQAAESLGDENQLAYCFEQRAELSDDHTAAAQWLCRMAAIFERTDQEDKALSGYERALQKNPDALPAIAALIGLYRRQQQHLRLLELLQKQATLLATPEERSQVYLEMARLAGEHLQQPETAIHWLERLLDDNPDHPEAIKLLPDWYRREQNWSQLARFFRERLGQASASQQLTWRYELVDIYRHHLKDDRELKEIYRQILQLTINEDILLAFQEVCQRTEDWPGLILALNKQTELTQDRQRLATIYYQTAKIYHRHFPDLAQAIAYYEKALEYGYHDPALHADLRQLYFSKGDYQRALDAIENQLSETAERQLCARLLLEKGRIYQEYLHNSPQAVAAWQQAIAKDPSLIAALERLEVFFRSQGDCQALVAILEQKKDIVAPEEAIPIQIEITRIFQRLGQDEQAGQYLAQLLARYPRHEEIRQALENFYRQHQEWSGLEQLYRQTLMITDAPQNQADILFSLAGIYLAIYGDRNEAASLCLQTLKLQPHHLPAIKSLQQIYKSENRLPALVESYVAELAIPDIPTQRRIALHLACADLFADAHNDSDQSLYHYQQTLQLAADNLMAIRGLQRLYRQHNNFSDLKRALLDELAIEANENRLAQIHLELADIHLRFICNLDDAIKHLEKARHYRRQDREILARLKLILKENQRWEQYATCLEEELTILPTATARQQQHWQLAKIYADQLDQPGKAIAHLEQAAQLGDLDLEALELLAALYRRDGANNDKLVVVYQKQERWLQQPQQLATLYQQIAELYFQELHSPALAIAYFEKLQRLLPNHHRANEMLSLLYLEEQRWQDLAMHLAATAGLEKESSAQEQAFYKAATIWEKKLDDSDKALGYYQKVITLNPDNIATIKGMRRLLEARKDWHGVLDLLYKEVRLTTGKRRASLYLKIAKIWELKLNNLVQAVDAYLQMLKNHFHWDTANHLLSLLRSIKAYDTMSWLLPKMISRAKDSHSKAEKYYEFGELLLAHIKKPEAAIRAYKKVLKHMPAHPEALNALEQIYNQEQQWQQLAQIKENKLEIVTNQSQIRKLHLDLGQLCQQHLYDEQRAMVHYERAFELGTWDLALLHTLQDLYREWGYFEKYIDLAEKEMTICQQNERQLELLAAIAAIWNEKLFSPPQAIVALERILTIDSGNKAAMAKLAQLYQENSDYPNLARIYQMQLAGDQLENERKIPLLLELGQIAVDKLADFAQAESAFRQILAIVPGHQEALVALEQIYQQSSEKLPEIIQARIVGSQSPEESIPLYRRLAQVYHQHGDLVKARSAYEKLDSLLAPDRQILTSLQELYRQLGDIPALIAVNERLIALDTRSEEAARCYQEIADSLTNDPKRAMSYLEKAIAAGPISENFETLCRLANEQQDWQCFERTIEQWLEHEKLPRQRARLYWQRAQVRLTSGRSSEALADLEQAWQSDQNDRDIALALADLHYRLENWERAQAIYEIIIRWPEPEPAAASEIYLKLGHAAMALGHKETAVLRYRQLSQLAPDYVPGLLSLGDIYYQDRQWEDALLIYMKLDDRQQLEVADRLEIQLRLAVIKDNLEMITGAIEEYQRVLEENPQEKSAVEALGRLYFESQEEEKALGYFQKLAQLADSLEERQRAVLWLAKLHEYMENLPQAISAYKQLLEITGVQKQYVRKIFDLHTKAGDWQQALDYGRQSHALAADIYEKAQIDILLGSVHWQGYHHADLAIEHYQSAVTAIPTCIPAIRNIAAIHASQEQWQRVVDIYREAGERIPETASRQKLPLLLEQATIMTEKLQQQEQAIAIYEQIVDIDPDHGAAQAALAVLWGKYPGKRNDAINQHRYLLTKDPFRAQSYHELFHLYLEEKEYDRAYLCCQALCALEQLQPEERKLLEQVAPRVAAGLVGWLPVG